MERFLEKTEFLCATQESRSAVNDWFRRNYDFLYYGKDVTADDLMGALREVRRVTCRPDYPPVTSDAAYVAKDVLQKILDIINDRHEAGRIESKFSFLDFCFDYVIDLLNSGPGSTQMMLWQVMLSNSTFGLNRYYNTLSGKKLLRLIEAMKKEWTSSEPGLDIKHYGNEMQTGIRYLLDRLVPSDETLKEAQPSFVDLYIFCETAFLGRDNDVITRQHHVSSALFYRYDRNPFAGIVDPDFYRKQLKVFESVICSETFPRNEHETRTMTNWVKYFLAGITHTMTLFPLLHVDIMDFVSTVCCKKSGCAKVWGSEKRAGIVKKMVCPPVHGIIEAIGYWFFHIKEPPNQPVLKGNSEFFESMTRKMTSFLDNLKDTSFVRVKFVTPVVFNVLCIAMGKSADHVTLFIGLLKSCLKISEIGCAEAAYRGCREKENIIKWKGRVDDALEILDILSKVHINAELEKQQEEMTKYYVEFAKYLLEQIKRDRILKDVSHRLLELCFICLDRRDPLFFPVGSNVVEFIEFNAKKNKAPILKIFKHLYPLLLDNNFPWDNYDAHKLTVELTSKASRSITDSKVLEAKELDSLVAFVRATAQKDFISSDNNIPETVFFYVFANAGINIVRLLDDDEKISRAQGLIKDVVALLANEFQEIINTCVTMVTMMADKGPKFFAPHLDKLIDVCLDEDITSLLTPITQVYPYSPRSINPHFQTFFEMIESGQPGVSTTILIWLPEVAKRQPDLFTDDNIETLIEEMFSGSDMNQHSYLTVLDVLARKRPSRMAQHLESLVKEDVNVQYGVYQMVVILKYIAVNTEQSAAERVMAYYERKLRELEDQVVAVSVLNEMRSVGVVHRPLLDKRAAVIKNLKEKTRIESVRDTCTFIIDVLEGRSLEALSVDVKEVKDDVEELDERLVENEESISRVSGEVKKQNVELTVVKGDVKEQGKKLDSLQETVDETVVKVEEIDNKTLSHAPFWSRDVSKLINPNSKHDWRLLGSRLGYSNDDIRAWSQQADPCMAMLNEWYTTHKTRDATFAILNNLQEMDRMDAAVIVENAMKMAETVVEDEPLEYAEPPAIFISYQWGYQNEVKLLARHLEMAGYNCWLDVGQMGGGDKLFEKIDRGIRSAKLVISCVTEKYAKSPNCNCEVNLAVNLGKPLIPLLMEKCNWPPPGSMGPIFSEYIFVRFFTRPGEETRDDRYWAAPKFQELLMQLNYNNIMPDAKKVVPEYKDWWLPVVEEIKIKKRDHSLQANSALDNSKVEAASPEVFISYQWGKQKQVLQLYKRLMELGFPCWMDIYQMGGGDSLYDKIDKGVRGSKVVLSCVTAKYAFSANCRREVSLADALKKPIIPLLLENMTWPPSGPMSLVFTQLLYINFSKDVGVQERWNGPQFDELVVKIKDSIPQLSSTNSTQNAETDKCPDAKNTSLSSDVNKPTNQSAKANTKPLDATKPTLPTTSGRASTTKTVSSVTMSQTTSVLSSTNKVVTSTITTQAISSASHGTSTTKAASLVSTSQSSRETSRPTTKAVTSVSTLQSSHGGNTNKAISTASATQATSVASSKESTTKKVTSGIKTHATSSAPREATTKKVTAATTSSSSSHGAPTKRVTSAIKTKATPASRGVGTAKKGATEKKLAN